MAEMGEMADLARTLAATRPVWWSLLKGGAKVLVDAGESILGDEVKKQTRKLLVPVLEWLDKPEAQTAFDEAFAEASNAFLARYDPQERDLPREMVSLLSRAVDKELDQASREVLQAYLLTDEPRRAPLDRWVQRQLGGKALLTPEGAVFTQQEVTDALDIFFRELLRALLDQEIFREDMFDVKKIELLSEIRDAVRKTETDLDEMQREYLDYVARRNEWIELRGIAPRVRGSEVKMRMKDLFVPLSASLERDIRDGGSTDPPARLLEALEAGLPLDEAAELAGVEFVISSADADESAPVGDWRPLVEFLGEGRRTRAALAADWSGHLVGIAELLAEQRVVVLGDPGSGKSTLLRYVAYAVAENDVSLVGEAPLHRLPILVRIADFARARRTDPSLTLVRFVRDESEQDFAPLFQDRLARGVCVVLLDGLDEVAETYQRGQVVREIESFVARYPDNRYVVTSRIVGYEHARLDAQFRHFTLAELPPETISDFVARWYDAIESEPTAELRASEASKRAEELSTAIQEHPGIQRLATNPLLLTIIALVNWQGRKLPNRRVELYQVAAETLIENWPLHQRGVHLDAEQVMTILAPVAYHIFATQAGEYISKRQLMPRLAEAIQREQGGRQSEATETSEAMLASVSTQSGIFLERGYDASGAPVYGFLHLAFAEYLTARYLAARWAEGKLPWETFCHVPRWREVTLLAVAHIGLAGRPQATQTVSEIVELGSPYEEPLHRDLLLCGSCLADDLRLRPETARAIIERLTDVWLGTHITRLQDTTLSALEALGGTIHQREVERVFCRRLGDDNPEVPSKAAEALGDLGGLHPNTVSALCDCLGHGHAAVRANAAQALSQAGAREPHTGSQLVDLLAHEDLHVRRGAAKALGRVAALHPEFTSQLRQLLGDEDPGVRAAAADALGKTGTSDPETAAQLRCRLGDENPLVRSKAVEALTQIEWSDSETLPVLRDLVNDDQWLVRYWAVRGLTQIGASDADTISALRASLVDQDWRVRYTAGYSLLQLGSFDQQTISALHQCLGDENPHVRCGTVRALAQLGTSLPSTIGRLRECLDDGNVDVRSNAARALARLGASDPETISALHSRLDDEDWRVRYAAAFALAYIAPRDAHTISSLRDHLADGYWHIAAACALAQMAPSDFRAVSSLADLLADGYWHARHDVTHILLMVDFRYPSDVVFDLLDRICDHLLREQSSAACALARTSRPHRIAISHWRNRLLHADWGARDRAAYALACAHKSDTETISALRARLQDENVDVRCSAAYALRQLGASDSQTIAALADLLKDAEFAFFAGRRPCNEAYSSILGLLDRAARQPPLLEG